MPLITTTNGLMPSEALRRVEGVQEDDAERTTWVEYYDGDDLVHRSAHVHLKTVPAGAEAFLQAFGG